MLPHSIIHVDVYMYGWMSVVNGIRYERTCVGHLFGGSPSQERTFRDGVENNVFDETVFPLPRLSSRRQQTSIIRVVGIVLRGRQKSRFMLLLVT